MQVTVQNENTVVVDVQQQETIVVEVDQGRAGRGIQNITYTEVSGQYFLIVTYTDGTTETLGPLVVTGGAAFLLGGATGSIPYQSAPNTTVFLPIGTQNQVVVAGATAPQYTSALTGLTVNNSAIGNTAPSTGAFTNLSASGTFALTGDQVQISEGGTGQTTANGAFNALAPSQTGNAGKYLKTDGTNSSWDQLDISTADITGTLPIANGGTGQTTANSALNALLPTQAAQSGKYLKTDGTNASWDQLDISTADITGVLPIANGGTGASTAAGARANLSAAILGTNNDITSMTGLTGGISTPDFVQFDTTATEANAVGKVYWDASQGTLDLGLLGGNVITRIGQTLVAYVTNAEAVTITKGQVVYLFGAQGDRATVKLASNLSDATSAKTFGVVAENIGPNQTGFVMCQGVLEGLNLGAFTAGDTLYLGATPGSLTATKPAAPNHLVYVGLVERANAGNGQLYVKVQNGYELDEIHDVQIINPQNGQTILYDASTSLWKNANLTAGSGISVTNGAASVTIGNTGVLSFSGGTTGLTPATSTTGAVTLGGTLAVASGGTGATTAGGALTNLGAASSAITISAGTGLTGGGDLTANRTLSIANTTVTAASYGSASSVGTFTVNAQGQLTAAASTPIAIANTQVSGLGTMSTQNSNSVTITGGSITGITDLAIADGGTGASDAPTARTNLGLGTSATLNAGVALGVATLDAGGTVPLSQLPASIQGGVSYQGSWDAATNTPTIVSSVGTKGYYYVVSVAGSTNINGISDWLPGDWIIFNGSIWQKIDNTDAVASVNGYTGVVVLNAADVGAAPTSRTITAGTGLTGGGDLSANRTISIANTTVAAGSYGSASSVGTFTVNGQGQLTAAASTPIAITNTQVSGLGTMSTQNAGSVAITGGTIDGTTIGGTTRAAGSFTTLTLTNALSVANGGTGTTTSTGTGSVVLSSSPTLTTPNLGTPSAATLTNATGLPLTTGVTGTLPIGNGGTGQTTANAAFNALAPSQTGNAGKYLTTDGTNTSWATNPLGTVTSVDVSGGTTGLTTSGGPITSSGTITLGGTLATTNGGTGLTSFTANRVFYASSTSAIGQSANLTFDGTTLTAANFADSSLTSGRVTYATTGGNLTDSANLTFDGTNLGIGTSTPAGKLTVFNNVTGSPPVQYLIGDDFIGDIRFARQGTISSFPNSYAMIRGLYGSGDARRTILTFWTSDTGSSTEQLRLDSSGNLGLGVTPSAWDSSILTALQVRSASISSVPSGANDSYFSSNAFYNASWKYITTSFATQYRQANGIHSWFTAPSGTAGNAISFTQAMTLSGTSDAVLLLGTTSPAYGTAGRGLFEVNGSSTALIAVKTGDTARGYFAASSSITELAAVGASQPLVFTTNAAERARITSGGDLLVGYTTAYDKLQVNGSISSQGGGYFGFYRNGPSNNIATLDGVTISQFGISSGVSTGRSDASTWIAGFDSLRLVTAGIERARITSVGDVGIGTSSPGYRLQVDGASTAGFVTPIVAKNPSTNAASAVKIGFDNGGTIWGEIGASYNTNDPYMAFFVRAGSEKMRITDAGNLGLGVTPSAWGSSFKALQLTSGSISSNSVVVVVKQNTFFNGTNDIYSTTGAASDYYQLSGSHVWRTATSGTAGTTVPFTQSMTLDSAGRLLIGTTSATASGGFLQIGQVPNSTSSSIGFNNNDNAVISSRYSMVFQNDSDNNIGGRSFDWKKGGKGYSDGTSLMSLDANGNLGVGTTSPGGSSTARQVTIQGTTAQLSLSNGAFVTNIGNNGTISYVEATGANALALFTNSTERARITSGGYFKASNTGSYLGSTGAYHEFVSNNGDSNVLVLTNSNATLPYGLSVYFNGGAPNDATRTFLQALDTGATRATIRSNGGIANFQANDVNLSDRREKTNFSPAKNYLDTICAIPVQTFNYIDQSEDDPGLTLGVVAQDVQAVAPELVQESNWGTEDNPKMRLSIYQTDLQYALMKCIQELKAELDTVKAELATLKGN